MPEENSLYPEYKLPYREANAAIQQKVTSDIYKLRPADGTSSIWKIFHKIEDNNGFELPDKVCCGECYTVLTYTKRTSSCNLARHHCFLKNNSNFGLNKKLSTRATPGKHRNSSRKTESNVSNENPTDNNYTMDNYHIRCNVLAGSFKLQTSPSRGKIWHLFKMIEDNEGNLMPNKICCKMCFQVFTFIEHKTSSLLKHRCFIRAKDTITTNNNNFEQNSDLMEIENSNNEYVETTSSTEMEELLPNEEWQESNTMQELEESLSTDAAMNSSLKTEVESLFSEWCIENCRPVSLATDSGLRRFAELMIWIGANFGTKVDVDHLLPKSADICKRITSEYEETLKNIKNQVVEDCQNGFSLTSKVWVDNYWQQSYIYSTIHYIKNGQLVSKYLGLNAVHTEKNLDNIIEVKLEQVLNKYSCFSKDAIIVTDGNFKLSNFTHIKCINHILDNVINEVIEEVTELAKLNSLCLQIKEFFAQSNIACNLSELFNSSIKKWNTFYYLLNTISSNWQEVDNILQQNEKLFKCESISKCYIEQVLNILKPFKEVSTKLECTKYPTIHLVYACVSGLKDSCLADDSDDNNIRTFKEVLSKKLQTAVFPNINIIHKIALFLFPPANKLLQFSEEEKQLIKTEIISILQPYAQIKCEPSIKKEQFTPSKSNEMVTSYLKNFVAPSTTNNTDQISNEIHLYEGLKISFEENFNILQWWHKQKSQFPLLYKLSCRILATPATCESSDLVCSMVRQTADSNTNILSNPETLNQLIFLNFHREKKIKLEKSDDNDNQAVIENNVIEEI